MPKTIAIIKIKGEPIFTGNVNTFSTTDAIKEQINADKNLEKYLLEYNDLKKQVKQLQEEILSLKEEVKILKGE